MKRATGALPIQLAFVLASQRHFALEQAARGVAVRYVADEEPYAALLAPLAAELGALRTMTPAECELRADRTPLVLTGALELPPHEGRLTSSARPTPAYSLGPRLRSPRAASSCREGALSTSLDARAARKRARRYDAPRAV